MLHHLRSWTAGLGLLLAAGLMSLAWAGPGDELNIENILKMTAPSVVKVEARNGVRKVATGVVIDKDGTIVTTALISPREEEITVLTADGKRLKAEFKGFDIPTGLAVLQVKEKGLSPILPGTSADARPGVWIGAVSLSPENTPAVSQGIISSASDDRLRLNLWVMPGASGSPIVDSNGHLIGVLRGTYVDEQPVYFEFRDQQVVGTGTVFSRAEAPSSGMALAVPVDVVLSVAADIRKGGKVQRGWLGITVKETKGRLEIDEIVPKSPADKADFKKGDLVTAIDGRNITAGAAVSREVRKRKPGNEITFTIQRDGASKDVKVKLGEFTQEEGRRELENRFPGLFPPPPSFAGTLPGGRIPGGVEEFFGRENRKNIGVTVQELTKDLAAYFGAPDGQGLLVTEFSPESSARKAGVKIGDVILKADGRKVSAGIDLSGMIREKTAGEKIRLEILRDKKTKTIDVPITEETNQVRESDIGAVKSIQEYRNHLDNKNWLSPMPGLSRNNFKK